MAAKRPKRPHLGVYLTPEAKRGWDLFAKSRNVSVTGMLEALGPILDRFDGPDEDLPPLVLAVVLRAREIDHARRRRLDGD